MHCRVRVRSSSACAPAASIAPTFCNERGNYPVPPGASDIPGLEVAGEIIAGDAAAMAAGGFNIGDRANAAATPGYGLLADTAMHQLAKLGRLHRQWAGFQGDAD